jgi:folate-binding protein YgfZ
MTQETAYLTDRGIVRVSGADAQSFLQGLLTNDVETLRPGEARFAALLTPQGKILFDFLVLKVAANGGEWFLLDCSGALAPDLAKRLGFYRLRAKVEIVDESADHGIIAFWDEEPENAPGGLFYADPRESRLGWRAILPSAKAVAVREASVAEYEAHRIGLGVPKGGLDFAYGDAFPSEADMDMLNGVDFAKGCYVGQEVVSRMKHRGAQRKRVVPVWLGGEAPAPGTPILDGELTVGTLGSSAGLQALAMLRLDRVGDAKAAGRALTAAGVPVAMVEG